LLEEIPLVDEDHDGNAYKLFELRDFLEKMQTRPFGSGGVCMSSYTAKAG